MKKQAPKVVIRGTFIGDTKPSDVVVRGGKVERVGRAGKGAADVGSAEHFIGPTLFDIQINGAFGINLQEESTAPEDFLALNQKLREHGVSQWAPTIITGSQERMEHACRVFAEAMKDKRLKRAVPGLHNEGPHISPTDGPRGAHNPKFVTEPSLRQFDALNRAADGQILYETLAPEIKGAPKYIEGLVKRGVKVALGHHEGTAVDIDKAVEAGASFCTHLGNGLAASINRHHNPLWPQLSNDGLSAALIADLHHLPVPVLKTFVRVKGPQRVILTSDAVHIAGLKPGTYELGGMAVELTPQGRVCLTGTELLAGSALMLLQGIVNAAAYTDLTLEEAFSCATTVPRKVLGVRQRPLRPQAGRRADLICFRIEEKKGRPTERIDAVYIEGDRTA